MSWEAYAQMCVSVGIEPTKASWHAYLRQALADLKRIMEEEGLAT
jgi:hypothetical protein